MTEFLPHFPPMWHSCFVLDDSPLGVALKAPGEHQGRHQLFYNLHKSELQWAVHIAPNAAMANPFPFACASMIAWAEAFGSLAPPEVAAHFSWPFTLLLNGAEVGALRVFCSGGKKGRAIERLVIGVRLFLARKEDEEIEPGANPNRTTLYDEGCAEVSGAELVSAWSRYMLSWMHVLEDDGKKPVMQLWRRLIMEADKDIPWPFTNYKNWSGFDGPCANDHAANKSEPSVAGQDKARILDIDEFGNLTVEHNAQRQVISPLDFIEVWP